MQRTCTMDSLPSVKRRLHFCSSSRAQQQISEQRRTSSIWHCVATANAERTFAPLSMEFSHPAATGRKRHARKTNVTGNMVVTANIQATPRQRTASNKGLKKSAARTKLPPNCLNKDNTLRGRIAGQTHLQLALARRNLL